MMRTLLLAAVAALACPATAAADSLLAPSPGAVHLTAGGGYMAWAAPNEDTGWSLVVRAPDGTVTRPDIPGFAGPPNASIGTLREDPPAFRLLAVYARDDGDIHQLDLRTGREEEVTSISSRAYRESAPSLDNGVYAFVRSGGRRSGVFVRTGNRLRRLDRLGARETATSGSRVAWIRGGRVFLARSSGEGPTFTLRGRDRSPRSVVLTRYRVSWLEDSGRVFQTPRFGGSGRSDVQTPRAGARTLPASTRSIALERDRVALFADGAGVKRADPRPFGSGG